jgi:hypothetical protein
MRTAIALTCLALLVGVNEARAQATHSLSVSRHVSVPFNESQVDDILTAASKILHTAGACDVTLKRVGPIQTFTSPNRDGVIRKNNQSDRDAVHRVNFDSSVVNVKIVNVIDFCIPNIPPTFRGCSFPTTFKSIIVEAGRPVPELVWPHEFGHQTGLWHRGLDGQTVDKATGLTALMSPCPLGADNVQLNQDECTCLKQGQGACHFTETHSKCPRELLR